jgi:hypothetical protein
VLYDPGISTLQKNGMNDRREASDLTEDVKATLPQAMDAKESWWRPIFLYEQIRLDPKDPLGKMQKRTSVNGFTREYTVPFSAKRAG